MADSPRLGLTYLTASQAQKHVTVNDALRELDALVQTVVQDRNLTAPPGSPVEGAIYIIGGTPTGGWASFAADDLVIYSDAAWYAFTPAAGWRAYVLDEELMVEFDGTDWVRFVAKSAGFKAEKTTNTVMNSTWTTVDSYDTVIYNDTDGYSFNTSTGVLTVVNPGRYIVGCSALLTSDGAGTNAFQPNVRLMRSTDGGSIFSAVFGFRNGIHCIGGDADDVALCTTLPVETTVANELLVMQERAFGSLTDVPEFEYIIFWAERIA